MSNPPNILFSSMVTLSKGNGLKGILNCPSKILLLLPNVGEIILIIKFLRLLRFYGKKYHFIGSIDRISVFGPKPYANALVHLRIADHPNPRSLLILGKTQRFEPLLYCGLCNKYAIYHEHACDDNAPWDPYDGYPSDSPSTD